MGPDDPRHGTYAGYVQQCRCEPCRAANSDATRARRASRRGSLAAESALHGTDNAYVNYSCRCIPCTAAHYRTLSDYWLRRAKQLERSATKAAS